MKGFLITLLIFWLVSRFLKKNVYINTFNYNNPSSSQTEQQQARKKEGEIYIEKVDKNKKNKKDDGGDFVDYEEIK